jgi:hypothetical protein
MCRALERRIRRLSRDSGSDTVVRVDSECRKSLHLGEANAREAPEGI